MNFTVRWIPWSGSTKLNQIKIPSSIIYKTDEKLLSSESDQVLENVHILEAAFTQHETMEMADRGDFLGAQWTMHMFQEKLEKKIAQTGSWDLQKLQKRNVQMLNDLLKEEKYTKDARKKLHYTMYDLWKKR